MKKHFQVLVLFFSLMALMAFSGCGDPDEEFRPREGKKPNAPVTQGRSTSSDSFLPSSGGSRQMTAEDENVLGGN